MASVRGDGNGRESGASSPALSIVVPTHNREELLRVALASLRAQDLEDCEFLVLDNASRDDTPRLVTDLQAQDRRFRLIRNEEDIGFQRNIHQGLLAAHSDRILMLADDDVLLPGTAAVYAGIFDRDPAVAVVLCNMVQLDSTGTQITYVHRRFPRDTTFSPAAARVHVWAEAAFISGLGLRRNEEFRSWRPDLIYPQLELVARLLRRGRAVGTAHFGVGARVHQGQLGNAILDEQEQGSLPHVFGELPRILREVYGGSEGVRQREAFEPFLRKNYRIFVLNRRIDRGSAAAWRSVRLGLRTYPRFRRNPAFLASLVPMALLPAWVSRSLKEAARRQHLSRHAGPSMLRRLGPALAAYADGDSRKCEACGSALTPWIEEIADYRFDLPGMFRVLHCQGCGIEYTDPVPEDVGSFYPPEYAAHLTSSTSRLRALAYRTRAGATESLARGLGNLVAPFVTLLTPRRAPGELLDVGCGSGRMLAEMQKAGWRVTGVESDEDAVRRAKQAGFDVLPGSFETVSLPPVSFDLVRMSHVLEHTDRPRAWIERAFTLLRPGGVLLVGVPNLDGATVRAFGRYARMWDVPRHLSHFTMSTLVDLLKTSGFRVVRRRFNSVHSDQFLGSLNAWLKHRHGIRVRWLERTNIYRSPAPLLSILFDSLGIGDNIEVTAKKPR